MSAEPSIDALVGRADLDAAGIAIIQLDEPGLREGFPLQREDCQDYLRWAVSGFRVASSGLADDTQVHTYMCYAERCGASRECRSGRLGFTAVD